MSTQESVQARHLNGANGISASAKTDTDAIVIGAGFGGIRMLYELHKQGLSARVFEAGSGVGGVCSSSLQHSYRFICVRIK